MITDNAATESQHQSDGVVGDLAGAVIGRVLQTGIPAAAAAVRSIWSKPTPARTMMRHRLKAETKAASIFISCQATSPSQAPRDSSGSSPGERARRMSQSTSPPAVWRSMMPSSTYCASGVRRRNRAMAILCFGSQPVMAERIFAEKLLLLALGEGSNGALER